VVVRPSWCRFSLGESSFVEMMFCSGHCQELAPKYREAAATLASADLPRPVVLAKYDDSTDSQRQLRAGAEDGECCLSSKFSLSNLTAFTLRSVQLQRVPRALCFRGRQA
jgi:hypothetical protein